MRKQVLEENILPVAKQRIVIQGIAIADILAVDRDIIEDKLGIINLPDQTRVPGGRVRAGEFKLTLQLASDAERNAFIEWHEDCVDDGGTNGIDPEYKRDAVINYLRLYKGGQEVRVNLYDCWPSMLQFGNYDINNDDGDNGDSKLQITLNFDDISLASQLELLGEKAIEFAKTQTKKQIKKKIIQAAATLAEDAIIALL